jgi:hypothetical protein
MPWDPIEMCSPLQTVSGAVVSSRHSAGVRLRPAATVLRVSVGLFEEESQAVATSAMTRARLSARVPDPQVTDWIIAVPAVERLAAPHSEQNLSHTVILTANAKAP